MAVTQRTLRVALFAAAVIFAASAARAESVAFETVAGSGGVQSGARSGGQTSTSKGAPPVQTQTGRVENVDLGDVTGIVCDCGEIPLAGEPGASSPGGGFPRLPLLAFAAAPGIPCIFTDLCSREPPPPPPPPPPPGVPEPLTILSFATGLGAFAALRRRRHR